MIRHLILHSTRHLIRHPILCSSNPTSDRTFLCLIVVQVIPSTSTFCLAFRCNSISITFCLKQYPTYTTDATFTDSPFGNLQIFNKHNTYPVCQNSQTFDGQRWRYARHSTGHMLATHALAPISFGERGEKGEQCQYFDFNSRSVVRFLSTRYGSYLGSTKRFQLKNGQECLLPT